MRPYYLRPYSNMLLKAAYSNMAILGQYGHIGHIEIKKGIDNIAIIFTQNKLRPYFMPNMAILTKKIKKGIQRLSLQYNCAIKFKLHLMKLIIQIILLLILLPLTIKFT